MDKPVLDATCGSRMIWFDKSDDRCLFVDQRELDAEAIWTSGNGKATRYLSIHPDVIASFENMPFPDNTFYHVVFDPPHLNQIGDSAWMCKKYGKLPKEGWQTVINNGFKECMRVLKPNGTLIFKWSETQIPIKEVIAALGGAKPLYGTRSGKQHKTIWMAFIKEGNNENII